MVAQVAPEGDLFVVGDVHGDFDRLRELLVGAGIADGTGRWTGGDSTLIFVGDFIGKHKQSLRVIAWIRSLREEARGVGGDVIATMGNHEAEFLAPELSNGHPEWAKKVKPFLKELKKAELDPEDVWRRRGSAESRKLGELLHCLPVAAKSDRWFFAHAGSTKGKRLAKLTRKIEAGVDESGYRTPVLLDDDTGLLEARMKPVWWQKKNDSPEKSERRLRRYVKKLGVRHLAVGHQAGKYEFNGGIKRRRAHVFQLFDGTIYLTDVGMSRGHDDERRFSPGAVLHIDRRADPEVVTVICPDRSRHELPPRGRSSGVHCPFP